MTRSLDLRAELRRALVGRVCLIGVGNTDLGDDAVGVHLAEALRASGHVEAIVAGTAPERWVASVEAARYDTVVFLDAVEVAGAPGSVVLMEAGELKSRFPQVSTHKISLGTLARLLERGGKTRVWLLGLKPASLSPGSALSPEVEGSMSIVKDLLSEALPAVGELLCEKA